MSSRLVLIVCAMLLVSGSSALARKDPAFRSERYKAAHGALVPTTRDLLVHSRTLQRELSRLRPDDPKRASLKHQVTVDRTHAKKLREGLGGLPRGGTIGQSVRRLDGEVKTRRRRMRKLFWRRLFHRASQSDNAEKRRLAAKIEGLRHATNDLLDHAGWRGAQIIPEVGVHGLVPMVGMAGVRAGVQINGPDTGRFPVKPYVRGQISGSLVGASLRGTAVVGGINGAYPSAGVQTPMGGVEYAVGDPVAQGDKLSLRTFVLQTAMTRSGVEGGFGIPMLPLLFTASVLVQNGPAKELSKKLRKSRFVAKFRAQSPTLDKALSDTPPPAGELLRSFRAERASRKQAKKLAKRRRIKQKQAR